MDKVTSKNKRHYKRNTFKFAECVSMMDIMQQTPESVGFFYFLLDKVMEVREREIARC